MRSGGVKTHGQTVSDALMNDAGSPEFVEECKADFFKRLEMMKKRRCPMVSKHNLEALRTGKLNFIVIGEI